MDRQRLVRDDMGAQPLDTLGVGESYDFRELKADSQKYYGLTHYHLSCSASCRRIGSGCCCTTQGQSRWTVSARARATTSCYGMM